MPQKAKSCIHFSLSLFHSTNEVKDLAQQCINLARMEIFEFMFEAAHNHIFKQITH